ncbi:MAG: hypothetical protein HY680_09875 [Chloroflexi bacterium]|nr:hypothetical protein [Chloroflexota bacterium]
MRTVGEILALAFVLVTLLPASALAQEGGVSGPLEAVGPYRVSVKTVTLEPLVNEVRFLVYVVDGATGAPVPEAQVRIRTLNQTYGDQGWAIALNTPQQPELYQANVHLEKPGLWQTAVEVSSSLGNVTVAASSLAVRETVGSSAGGYTFLVTGLILAGGGLYVTWRIRQAQRTRLLSSPGGPATPARS